ncbi:NADPH:quinone reductase [Nocardioides antri]|uniref:NADPH:quinone reductase n=1 Tax=Nocardioides antri TaxID=2607659 RepID=A0A5B1LYD7_9ACTN|nr:NADPH:quinone reductase [Nocardioides antri]KAA1425566.1 NADPH:quinone reductase [Nocardioides antri]
MKAVVYRQNGPSSVLEVCERPQPRVAHDEVLVRLARAGVNPTDWKGRLLSPPAFDEVTPGEDGAGTVVEVGPGVGSHQVGDRVWVMLAQHERPYGTAAELVAIPERRAVPLPDAASFDLGASLGIPAVTAHCALTSGRVSELGPDALRDQWVLVAGGAGAVGNAAIQLARWAGATVIATVSSPAKGALATAAGAHHVLDYREPDTTAEIAALAPSGIDLVVEVAPEVNRDLDLQVIANGGTIAVYGTEGGPTVSIPVRDAWSKNCRYRFLLVYELEERDLRAAADAINAAIADQAFDVGEHHGLPLRHFDLEQTADAHDAVEAGVVGKVLIDLDSAPRSS